MKIALVVYALETGGVESLLRSLLNYFINQGHETIFIETSFRGEKADYFQKKHQAVSIIPKWYESKIRHAIRLAAEMEKYDVLLLNDVPFAQSVLGLLPESSVVLPIVHMSVPGMVRNAISNEKQWDKIVCVSPGIRDLLYKNHGFQQDRVVVIDNGVEVPDIWPKQGVQNDDHGLLRVAYIGRIEKKQKGVLLLPDIFTKALSKNPDMVFDIIGDGPDLGVLKSKASNAMLGEKIRFHGQKDHGKTIELLKQQDVLILPSRYEGHPIVLLEALAHGVVPVVTKLPGHTDHVIRHGENGYLCEQDDIDAFSKALLRAASDRKLLLKLSQNCWETAFKKFSSQKMGTKYLQLVKRVVREKKEGLIQRSKRIEINLLGDLPKMPMFLVRPIRKMMKILGRWQAHQAV